MTPERAARLQKIAEEMQAAAKVCGPYVLKIAHLRDELKNILAEERHADSPERT